MDAPWAEEWDAVRPLWSAAGTVAEGLLGGRRSCQVSCKDQTGWQEQQGLCSHVKAARDGGDQESWGPFVQILPLISLPPSSEKKLCVCCQNEGAKQLLEGPSEFASSLAALPILSA